MRSTIFISLVFLASCASATTFSDKDSITINHHINGHGSAAEEAIKHCQKFGKKAKPDQTTCARLRCISYFNCIEK